MNEPIIAKKPHMLLLSQTLNPMQIPFPCESREQAVKMAEDAMATGCLTHATNNRLGYYLIGPGTSFLILPMGEYEELVRQAQSQAAGTRLVVPPGMRGNG
jgi:hypothetical protein